MCGKSRLPRFGGITRTRIAGRRRLLELSMIQQVDEAFPWLAAEIREDCAVVWRVFEVLSAKDIESGLPLFHPDGEYRSAFAPAEGGAACVGHDGLRKYFSSVFELFEVWRVTPTNFIGSDDRIMALCMFEFSGQGSHLTMEQPIGTIWMLRDGLIRRGFGFLNVDDALASMAAQCGRDRAEIESLLHGAEQARAAHQSA
jgi:ketosteroid isomerase-like protein